MSLPRRLDRLERTTGSDVCTHCHRFRLGAVRFVQAAGEVTGEDGAPCPGCGWPRVFRPAMGRDDEVD